MLVGMPNEIAREWNAGQTVLSALNQIQGEDQTKVFTGVRTEAGYKRCERLVKDQSRDNKVKVSPAKIATAWNEEQREERKSTAKKATRAARKAAKKRRTELVAPQAVP